MSARPIPAERVRPAAWQESTLLDATGSVSERFMRIVEQIPPRTRFTVNDLRTRLDEAAIPNSRRGGLMFAAAAAGLIEPVTVQAGGTDYPVHVRSIGRSAHRATVRVFRRLSPARSGGTA